MESAGREVYVTQDGHDREGCGSSDMPCKSIRYAVTQTEPNSKMWIDGSGAPYTNETSEGTEGYITVKHSLWISTWKSEKAIIQCTSGNSKLFKVVTENLQDVEKSASTCLTLSGMVIRNCTGKGFDVPGVISLVNAQLKLNRSEFIQNGIIVHHPQIVRNETCERIEVFVKNCSFKSNFVAQPFLYGISLLGCRNILLSVEDSTFHATPVSVKSTNGTTVHFTRVAFDGSGIKASSVQVTASPGDNKISFNQCNITNHQGSKTSPVAIITESVPQGTSTVTFTKTQFLRNRQLATSGAALSISSRFRKLVQLDIRLDQCAFGENSAHDVGGAVHITYVTPVHISGSHFYNNTALNGGAIFTRHAYNVTIANSLFENNSAINQNMANGGAIFAYKSDLQVVSTNFTDNFASYTGNALYASECTYVSLTSSQFENFRGSDHTSPQNLVAYISTVEPTSVQPTVKLTGNNFTLRGMRDKNVLFANGQICFRNNSLMCPDGQNQKHSTKLADYIPKYYDYVQIGAWCEACPPGKYRLSLREDLFSSDFESVDVQKKPNESCKACPRNAVCEYGHVNAKPNYWGLAVNGNVEMFLCPRGYCCDHEDTCVGYQSCKENRNGTLCTGCGEAAEKSIHLGFAECISSKLCWSGGAVLTFVLCFLVAFFILLVSHYRFLGLSFVQNREENLLQHDEAEAGTDDSLPSDDNPVEIRTMEEGNKESSAIVCFVSLVFFYQLSPVIYPRITASEASVDCALNSITEMFNLLPPVSSAYLCLNKLIPIPFSFASFLLPAIYYWSLLVLLVLGSALTAVSIRFSSSDEWRQRAKRFSACFRIGWLVFFLYSYIPLMRISLEAVSCFSFHNGRFLYTDNIVSCYESWQIGVIVYLVCCVAPLFLVLEKGAQMMFRSIIWPKTFLFICIFPIFGVFILIYKIVLSIRNLQIGNDLAASEPGEDELQQDTEFILLKPFRNCCSFRSIEFSSLTILLFRSFLLVTVASLLTESPLLQAFLLTLICILFTTHHFYAKWYESQFASRLESLLIVLLGIFSLMNMYSSLVYILGYGETGDIVGTLQALFDWFYRVARAIPFIFSIVLILRHVLRHYNHRQH